MLECARCRRLATFCVNGEDLCRVCYKRFFYRPVEGEKEKPVEQRLTCHVCELFINDGERFKEEEIFTEGNDEDTAVERKHYPRCPQDIDQEIVVTAIAGKLTPHGKARNPLTNQRRKERLREREHG